MSYFNIAVDGPAGAGKSTIAKAVAAKLGFIYVDTGAMYRAMALYFLRQGIGKEEEAAISAACGQVEITIRYEDGSQQVILNGENVSSQIRNEEVGNMASATSVYLPVREKLVQLQQELAKTANAQAKVYLTASSAVRAKRRYDELKEKGVMCNLEEIEQDIIERDYRDMHREHSPLKQAEDAVLVDSSDMTIEEVIDAIIEIARRKGLDA